MSDSNLTPESFKELGAEMAKAADKIGGVEKKVDEIQQKFGADVAGLAKDVGNLEKFLKATQSVSGGKDWKHQFNQFVKACYFKQKYGKLPEWLKHMDGVLAENTVEKARVDFTSTTAATAATFVPTLIWDDIVALRDIYGTVLPLCTRVTVPAGGSFRVPMDAVNPVAYFIAQGTELTEEGTPMSFGSATLVPKMTGTWVSMQNELLESAQSNVSGIFAARLIRAIVKKQEEAILQGEDSGDDPHDGLLVIASTNDQTNLASTPTLASMCTFVSESVADVQSLYDTSDTAIFMHPAKVLLLMATAVGASELTGALSWGSPRDGVPPTILGHRLIAHPMCLISSTYWATMCHPSNIIVAESGPPAIEFNPYQKWTTNQTLMRAMTHFDFTVGIASQISKADHT